VSDSVGDLDGGTLLSQIAHEFGRAIGLRGALRDAASKTDGGGPRKSAADKGPHQRGLLLLRAIYSAVVSIYREDVGACTSPLPGVRVCGRERGRG
jgi:hypothetical protein